MFGDLGFPKCQMEEAQAAYGFFPAPKKRERKKKDKMHKLKSNLIFQSRVSHVGNSFRAFWRFFHVRQNIVFLDNKSTKPKVGGDVFFYQKKEMKAFSVLLESGWFHQKQKVSEQKAENLFFFFFFVCKTCQSKTATCMLTCFCNTLKCKITRTRLRKGFWCQFNNYRYTTKDMPGESRWLTAGLVLHVSALLPFFFFFFGTQRSSTNCLISMFFLSLCGLFSQSQNTRPQYIPLLPCINSTYITLLICIFNSKAVLSL